MTTAAPTVGGLYGKSKPYYEMRQYRYSSESKEWVMLSSAQVAKQQHNVQKSSLRMVTYNVWFDNHARQDRIRAILGMLPQLDADVVCIQEATLEWIVEMTADEYVRNHYTISDYDGRTLRGYGVVLLSRLPMVSLQCWWLPSQMGRCALVATLTLNNEHVRLGTVHLESLDNPQYRAEQLRIISGALAGVKHAGLMGDFNFGASARDYALEHESLARNFPDYVDLWPSLHPDLPGLTFDTDANGMLGGYERQRYDKVMWRTSSESSSESSSETSSGSSSGSSPSASTNGWLPKRMMMLGTEPISGLDNVWPSDHFGLFAECEYVTH